MSDFVISAYDIQKILDSALLGSALRKQPLSRLSEKLCMSNIQGCISRSMSLKFV